MLPGAIRLNQGEFVDIPAASATIILYEPAEILPGITAPVIRESLITV